MSGIFLLCTDTTNPFRVAPEISYPDTLVAHFGTDLGTISPALLNDVETDSFSIAPQLPEGLSFERVSGAISGTPTGQPGLSTHTVIAHNQ